MPLKIIQSPDPVLSQVCESCTPGDKELVRLSKQLAHLMYKNNGCGIAAPQVGITKRMIVIDVDWDGDPEEKNTVTLINPEILEYRGEPETAGEGCLSCPGINVAVTRQPWVRVRYYDTEGDIYEIEGDELLGRCLQHEIDHLNGITLFESCDPKIRVKALMAYEEALAAGAKPGDTSIEVS